ncbi:Ig-like domain repeat protein, partial [Candidatus Bipolaricaulota bacterium]|nr:Ig-like domain repeat protein [Candidatus Bipolaricaulota bacterium]
MAGSFGVMAQCDTEMAITRTPFNPVIGQAVTIKWTLDTQACSGVAFAGTLTRCVKSPGSGTCDVLAGGVETSGGEPFEVEYLFSPSEAGIYTITGSYEGCTTCDPELNSCTAGPIYMTVSKVNTATSVISNLNPSTIGDPVTFTATITSDWIGGPAIGGTADFYIDDDATPGPSGGDSSLCIDRPVTNGQATCGYVFAVAGDHEIYVVYDGDSNYDTSTSASLTQTVNVGATTTTTVVSDKPTPPGPAPETGEDVTFTATVDSLWIGGPTIDGTVSFYAGGVPIAGYQNVGLSTDLFGDRIAECTSSFNAEDSVITITAVYSGDSNYASSDDSLSQGVVKATPTVSVITDTPDPSILGQPYLVAGAVTSSGGNPTGTVTVDDGLGNTYVGAVVDAVSGAWSCSITSDPTTAVGAATLTATYSGDDNFNTSNNTEPHTYTDPATRTEVMGAATPLIVNNTATFTVVVVDTSNPLTIPQGRVKVSVDPSGQGVLSIPLTGVPLGYYLTLDAAGWCTFTYKPTSAATTPHAISAEYLGDPEIDPDQYSIHQPSTGTFAQEIVKRAVDIQLVVSPTTAYIYAPVTLQIHVEDDTTEGTPGSLNGEPIVLDNGGQAGTFSPASPTLDSSGNCTVTYTPGAGEAGTTTITATYAGSSVYTGKSTSESLVVNLRPTETWVICSMEPLLVNEAAIDCTITVKDVAGVGTATAPGGSISSLTLDLAGSSAVYYLSGPTPSGTDSEWTFDYLCTALDELADFDTIKADFTASDGIHADSAGAFGQGIKRRPTITTLSGCVSTSSGVTCTATMEEDPGNDGVPVSLNGDLVLLGDPDVTKCSALFGASPSCTFSADSESLLANVTVRFDSTNDVHLPSTATKNIDRSDEFSPDPPSDPSNDGSDCNDGCGDGGYNIDQMIFNLNVADVTLAAIQMGLDTAALVFDVIPDPFAGGGVFVVAGFTIPISDILASISKGTSIAMAIARTAMSTDLDGDGLRDVIENTITGTDYNVYDTDGDGLGDGYEVTAAGGFYGGTRRPDPNNPDSDGDGLLDGEE